MRLKKFVIPIVTIFALVGVWSIFIEPGLLVQNNISKRWAGPVLKVAFFSDLHAGAPHISIKYINDLVERINSESPDLILIGGDLVINGVVGGSVIGIEDLAPILSKLHAPLGVFAVLGNHDWWSDGEKIKANLERHKITVLENKSHLIQVSSGFSFWLVGIGDEYTNHALPEVAFSQINSDVPKILFMHDPAALFRIKQNYFLTFAGHMHGGQIYIPGFGALVTPGKAPKSWASGWVDYEFGSLFVSKGIGTSIFPVRLNSIPEFVILKLER